MKAGTLVRVGGRDATVVHHWLDGYGIVWGHLPVDVDDLPEPDAMLRSEPTVLPPIYPSCVGDEYEVVGPPLDA